MQELHIALLGYGTVGKGVYQTIHRHKRRLSVLLGKEVKIVAVLVKNLEKHYLPDQDVILTTDFERIINLPKLDIVVDAIVGKEPGFSYLIQAINRKAHVITANKEMFAAKGQELLSFAEKQGVSIGFEATVAGGIPIIQTLRKLLNANQIVKIQGILNGTSNFILTKMREENLSFSSALKIAQDNGFAEADPTNDVEGYDAFYKAMILSRVIYGNQPDWETTLRMGISNITADQIKYVSSLGLRFKHIASLEKTMEGIYCSVQPVLVSLSHPFYHVEGVQNAVSIDGDIVGNISLQGPGAGMFPTASAIIEDLIQLDENRVSHIFNDEQTNAESDTLCKWLLFGKENTQLVGDAAISFVKAKEKDIQKVRLANPDITVYQLLGEYDFSKVQQNQQLAGVME